MKLNIAYPANNTQKQLDIEDELKVRPFYEKRIAQEVSADSLGPEWKGYVFKITGGADKDGFPMKQGVMTTKRVKLLLKDGDIGYRCKRTGVRRRKSVRGCIVDSNLSVLNAIIVKRGEAEIEGLTDVTLPIRLGPKRAGKIKKLFKLSAQDDVTQYVIKRKATFKNKEKQAAAEQENKIKFKSPKIQRLATPVTLHRRKQLENEKQKRRLKNIEQAKKYLEVLAQHQKSKNLKHKEHVEKMQKKGKVAAVQPKKVASK